MKKIIGFILIFCSLFARGQNIVAMEYFVDVDSGFGNNIPITGFSQLADVRDYLFTIPANLPAGIHVIGIRSMDASNHWSHTNFLSFQHLEDSAAGEITELEYFWDVDSGMGQCFDTVLTTPVRDLQNFDLMAYVPTSLSADSIHTLFVRSKNIRGQWSHTNYVGSVLIVGGIDKGVLERIKVYPNPFMNILNFDFHGSNELEFTIYSSSGAFIERNSLRASSHLDLSFLSQGIYLLKLRTEHNSSFWQKIVKL